MSCVSMPIVQGGPLRTSVITCFRPVGQIRVTDRTSVFIFITSGKDGARVVSV